MRFGVFLGPTRDLGDGPANGEECRGFMKEALMTENKLLPPISMVCFYVGGTDTPREEFMISSNARAETCTPCLKAGIVSTAAWIPPRTGYLFLKQSLRALSLRGRTRLGHKQVL